MWPPSVERVATFLRATSADARLEELYAGTATATAAADAVGAVLAQIVKSIVLVCDGLPVVALVPGDRRVDPQKVARAVGASEGRVATAEEVHAATGFAPGAVAPFPLSAVAAVLVEQHLLRHRRIWAGAGSPRHLVSLAPTELLRLTRGRVVDAVAAAE